MSTKERIHAAVDHVAEKDLEDLYRLINDFLAARTVPSEPGILAKLAQVKIDAPTDFAANFELYANGEKRVRRSF